MYYPEEYLERLKEEVPLFELAQEYTEFENSTGNTWKARCPLPTHGGDDDPSFKYHKDSDSVYCYGCNAFIPDSIGLIRQMEGLGFEEAVEHLTEKAGLQPPEPRDKEQVEKEEKYRRLLHQKARRYWHNLMREKENEHVRNYLYKRGITDELINRFRLGYCDFSEPEGSQFRKFTNRIMFPIMDTRGEIIGFSGRKLPDSEGSKYKYINSQNSAVFKKNRVLYNFNYAREAICREKKAIVVEGFTDVISLYKYGVENVVSTMGTALSDAQVTRLARYAEQVYLFFDPDDAGEGSMRSNLNKFHAAGTKPMLVKNDVEKDPDEVAREFQDRTAEWIEEHVRPVEQYYVDRALTSYRLKKQDIISRYQREMAEAKEQVFDDLRGILGSRLDHIPTEVALKAVCNEMDVSLEAAKKYLGRDK